MYLINLFRIGDIISVILNLQINLLYLFLIQRLFFSINLMKTNLENKT